MNNRNGDANAEVESRTWFFLLKIKFSHLGVSFDGKSLLRYDDLHPTKTTQSFEGFQQTNGTSWTFTKTRMEEMQQYAFCRML